MGSLSREPIAHVYSVQYANFRIQCCTRFVAQRVHLGFVSMQLWKCSVLVDVVYTYNIVADILQSRVTAVPVPAVAHFDPVRRP
jgi:hypothetical protein